jgi:hypothetical protein
VQEASEESCGVKFAASPFRYILLFLILVLMTTFSGAVAFGFIRSFDAVDLIMSYLGMLVFSLCAGALLVRAFRFRGTVLEVGPRGIQDWRLSNTAIPWSAVREVSTSYYRGYLWVHLDPAFAAAWKGSPVQIHVFELNGSLRDVETAIMKFWQRSKQR